MSQLRQYGKKPTRTISYNLAVRQSIGSVLRVAVEHPRGKREKQSRKGRVFGFQPDITYVCCKTKRCSTHFPDATSPLIDKAREPLFDKYLDRETLRVKLKRNWQLYLRLPDGRKCCKNMALKIYNCSSSLLYGNLRRDREHEGQSQGDANASGQKLATCIAAWFHNLKDTADCMPDGDWYQINAPLRSMVWTDYNGDAAEEGSTYKHCKSKSHFYGVWRDNFPEIRLRRHCRFAKCDFCVDWRRLGREHHRKAEAQERLKLHRAWANVRERGLFHLKREKAIQRPDEFISVSIDGMCVTLLVRGCQCGYWC